VNEVTELAFTSYQYDATHGTEVQVWYPRGSVTRESALYGFDFLLDARRLGADFEPVMTCWFELCGHLGSVVDAFLGPEYRPDTFLDNHFLNVASAAEGYHRILYRNEMVPKQELPRRGAG
jgi:hypothetical protein